MKYKFREIVKKQEFYLFESFSTNIGDFLSEGHYVKESFMDGSYCWFRLTKRDEEDFNHFTSEMVNKLQGTLLDTLYCEYYIAINS